MGFTRDTLVGVDKGVRGELVGREELENVRIFIALFGLVLGILIRFFLY